MATVKMRAPLGASSFHHEGVVYEVKDGHADVHDHAVGAAISHGFSPASGPPPATGYISIMRQHIHEMLEQLGAPLESATLEDSLLLDRLRDAVVAAKEKLSGQEKTPESDDQGQKTSETSKATPRTKSTKT